MRHAEGSADRGSAPNRARKGSRSIIRHGLQQLQAAKLVESADSKGRVVSSQGRAFLDGCAKEIMGPLAIENTELGKY